MADTYMSVGPAGRFHKKLHDNEDGTYSDVVYTSGITVTATVDKASVGAGDEAADTTGTPTGVLFQGDTGGTDNKRKNVAVDADGNLQVIVIESPSPVHYSVDFDEGETDVAVWTPVAGHKFVITSIILSFSSAGSISVYDDTDDLDHRVFKMNGAANGGMALSLPTKFYSAYNDFILQYSTGEGSAV